MAYWMTHLRVAERCLPLLPQGLSLPHYYAGALAPDCGITETDENGEPRYLPGRPVSHWLERHPTLGISLIQFDAFYDAYMPRAADDEQRAFYWGYYIHLVTDAMWNSQVLGPRRSVMKDTGEEAFAEMKRDLYRADLQDYREHPDYVPLEIIRKIGAFPCRWLEYYGEDYVERGLGEILGRLQQESAADCTESLWLSEEEREDFMMSATAKCMQMIRVRRA